MNDLRKLDDLIKRLGPQRTSPKIQVVEQNENVPCSIWNGSSIEQMEGEMENHNRVILDWLEITELNCQFKSKRSV